MDKREYSIEEVWIPFSQENIYTKLFGLFYIPKHQKGVSLPTVVICHGFGSGYYRKMPYAELLARNGIACLVFDFYGANPYTMSGGLMKDNSISLEVKELHAVMDWIEKRPFTEPGKTFLMGASMGGIVTTFFAARYPNRYAGMILLYPGFCLSRIVREHFHNKHSLIKPFMPFPRRLQSKKITEEAWNLHMDQVAKEVRKPVLIFQGMEDTIIRAVDTVKTFESFPNARVIFLTGEKHGFSLKGILSTEEPMVRFILNHLEEKEHQNDYLPVFDPFESSVTHQSI